MAFIIYEKGLYYNAYVTTNIDTKLLLFIYIYTEIRKLENIFVQNVAELSKYLT